MIVKKKASSVIKNKEEIIHSDLTAWTNAETLQSVFIYVEIQDEGYYL